MKKIPILFVSLCFCFNSLAKVELLSKAKVSDTNPPKLIWKPKIEKDLQNRLQDIFLKKIVGKVLRRVLKEQEAKA